MNKPPPGSPGISPEYPLPPVPPHRNPKKKKTRDLPNLSECNCCKRRINTTNPKNRLRILSSEWRIILLCNNCFSLIESSQFCSYCLSRVSISSIDSVFDCRRCNRRIHMDCVAKFGVNRGNSGDFSFCFDCWVPDLLLNDYIRDHNGRSKRKVRLCDELAELGSSRVCDLQDKGKSVRITANDGDVLDENRVAMEVEAKEKEKVVAKSVVGKRAAELVNDNVGDGAVEDDAKLAIRLHRAMNSSPRIARNPCMLDNSSNNVLREEAFINIDIGECANGVSSDFSLCGEQSGLCMAESSHDCAQTNGGMLDEKCNEGSNGFLITYSRKRHASQAVLSKEKSDRCVFKMYSRRHSRVERHNAECDHQRNAKFVHPPKTYSRRPPASSHCKKKLQCDGFDFQNGVLTLAIALDCCEESKAVSTFTS